MKKILKNLCLSLFMLAMIFMLPFVEVSYADGVSNLTGTTWEFNDTIDWFGNRTFNVNYSTICEDSSYNVDNGTELTFTTFVTPDPERPITVYQLRITDNQVYFNGSAGGVGTIFEYVGRTTGLAPTRDSSQTIVTGITITGGDDVADSDLISWLQSNATLVSQSSPAPAAGIFVNLNLAHCVRKSTVKDR